jgi:hypothetical protein
MQQHRLHESHLPVVEENYKRVSEVGLEKHLEEEATEPEQAST